MLDLGIWTSDAQEARAPRQGTCGPRHVPNLIRFKDSDHDVFSDLNKPADYGLRSFG